MILGALVVVSSLCALGARFGSTALAAAPSASASGA
jgi:hypothetical protein